MKENVVINEGKGEKSALIGDTPPSHNYEVKFEKGNKGGLGEWMKKNCFGQNIFNFLIISVILLVFVIIFVMLIFLVVFFIVAYSPPIPADPYAHAIYLAKKTPLIDGHNDYSEKLLWVLKTGKWPSNKFHMNRALTNQEKDVLRSLNTTIQTDIPRIKEGYLGGQFWAVYYECVKFL